MIEKRTPWERLPVFQFSESVVVLRNEEAFKTGGFYQRLGLIKDCEQFLRLYLKDFKQFRAASKGMVKGVAKVV
ncbi:hypothetical protein [Candidatus Sororendozoicomonas aggregata]|uniref:hypothetical protein n=1 Tax=Candidatus Sororendozoicomonas aggregata TaxID=3073239 RepID=UPI002ED5DD76